MEFTRPLAFLLLVAAVLLALAMRYSLADLTPNRARLCIVVRGVLLLAILLALAGFTLRLPTRGSAVIFVRDDSASVDAGARETADRFLSEALDKRPTGDLVGVVSFAENPKLLLSLGTARKLPEEELEVKDGTRIDRALRFAVACLPADRAGRIVLLSDGVETGGSGLVAAREVKARGIALDVVPLFAAKEGDALAAKLEVPGSIRAGEPFDAVATIRSLDARPAEIRLYRDQYLIESRAVTLTPGENRIRFANQRTDASFCLLEVEVAAEGDARQDNNRMRAAVATRGAPRVLALIADEAQLAPFTPLAPLASALAREQIRLEVRKAASAPRRLEELQAYDLLLVADVSVLAFAQDQMELYRRWVREFGGSFLMLGGENSFGAGGYFRSSIEEMLPVRSEHDDRKETPTVALLVALDRSGSMAAQTSGGETKIALANQGAVRALQVLQPRDWFGLFAVDTQVHRIVPPARVSSADNGEHWEQKILAVNSGGGGIYVYTAMAESFRALRETDARVKHLILFADAADAEEKVSGQSGGESREPGASSLDLAGAMLAERITLSVVALGGEKDQDTAFLQALAERGGGRFYLTGDATVLPQIFTMETMRVAQGSLMEEPFLPVPGVPSPATAGIDWKNAPLLLGCNSTKPKPTADILLATDQGDPLLATWRYGLGMVGAFTSDASARWAAEWLGWPGYGKFWAQTIRSLLRPAEANPMEIRVVEEERKLVVSVDALDAAGGFRNGLALEIVQVNAAGQTESHAAMQIAPGRYRAEFPSTPPGETSLFSVREAEVPPRTVGYASPYPREYLDHYTDEGMLRALAAEGRYNPEASGVFSPAPKLLSRRIEMMPFLLSLALLLLPLDIWLRRRA